VYRLGASEAPPVEQTSCCELRAVAGDKWAFAEMTKISHNEPTPTTPGDWCNITNRECIVANPPVPAVAGRDGPRLWLRSRASRIPVMAASDPAFEVVKDSVQIMRGCFGGCTFCSITAHEGRIIQSRSQESILGEVRQMASDPAFKAW